MIMAIHCVRKEGGYVVGRFALIAKTLDEAIREAAGAASEFDLWEDSRRLYSHPCDAGRENAAGSGGKRH